MCEGGNQGSPLPFQTFSLLSFSYLFAISSPLFLLYNFLFVFLLLSLSDFLINLTYLLSLSSLPFPSFEILAGSNEILVKVSIPGSEEGMRQRRIWKRGLHLRSSYPREQKRSEGRMLKTGSR